PGAQREAQDQVRQDLARPVPQADSTDHRGTAAVLHNEPRAVQRSGAAEPGDPDGGRGADCRYGEPERRRTAGYLQPKPAAVPSSGARGSAAYPDQDTG